MPCPDEQTVTPCPEIVTPTVIEDCPECAEGYIPTNCVTMSTAFPNFQIGKGTSLTNAFSKLSSFFQSLLSNSHVQNTDSQFAPNDGYTIYNTPQTITFGGDTYTFPSAKCQKIADDGTIFTTGIEDISSVGSPVGIQAMVYAFNPTTLLGYGVLVTDDGKVRMQYGSTDITLSSDGIQVGGLTTSAPATPNTLWKDSGFMMIT